MTSPVSPLATVLAPVRRALDWLTRDALDGRPHGALDLIAADALAVLDSLDGTITLSRRQAERIAEHIAAYPGPRGASEPRAIWWRQSGQHIEKIITDALLAARIEEAGK